jgi:flagellar motor switch protein FliN
MSATPLNWVKQIHQLLIDAKAIPFSGYAPEFPWDTLSEEIASLLELRSLTISPRKTAVLKSHELTSGFGSGFIVIALDLTPLEGQVFWIMGKEDVAKLTSLALVPSNGNKGFSSPKFQEGFYYFLASQVVLAIDYLHALGDLSPKIGKTAALPDEEALCIDVALEHPKHSLWGRLICPASTHQAFKNHFATAQPPALTSAMTKQLHVPIHFDVGHTTLSITDWKKVKVGDFIILDRCTFDPKTLKGTATLMLHGSPLLRARIKDQHLKIVDYAIYHEEPNQMPTNLPPDEEHPEENFEAEELSSTQFEENGEENHLWSTENGTQGAEKLVTTQEIPLMLTVEVARLQITLEKLLQLSPGNVLELPVHPEQGVSVVVGGKKVAKAELVKLGDLLGIKILQLGE